MVVLLRNTTRAASQSQVQVQTPQQTPAALPPKRSTARGGQGMGPDPVRPWVPRPTCLSSRALCFRSGASVDKHHLPTTALLSFKHMSQPYQSLTSGLHLGCVAPGLATGEHGVSVDQCPVNGFRLTPWLPASQWSSLPAPSCTAMLCVAAATCALRHHHQALSSLLTTLPLPCPTRPGRGCGPQRARHLQLPARDQRHRTTGNLTCATWEEAEPPDIREKHYPYTARCDCKHPHATNYNSARHLAPANQIYGSFDVKCCTNPNCIAS